MEHKKCIIPKGINNHKSISFYYSFRSISRSSSVTPPRGLSFWPRKSPNWAILASTFMQKWCRNTGTACSTTSGMDCAGTWSAQVGEEGCAFQKMKLDFKSCVASQLNIVNVFHRPFHKGNRHPGCECGHQFWLPQKRRDLPAPHWQIRWDFQQYLLGNSHHTQVNFMKVHNTYVMSLLPQGVLVTWVWLSIW